MSDLGSGKKGVEVTVKPLDVPRRPIIGRRKTTNDNLQSVVEAQRAAYDHQDDGLTKIGNFLWKIHSTSILTRYALYILPVAMILAIPLILAATLYRDSWNAGYVSLLGLFVWIEILWVSLWIAKLTAIAVP